MNSPGPGPSQQAVTPSTAVLLAQSKPLLPGATSPHRCSSPSTAELLTPEALAEIEKGIRQKEEEVARSLVEIDAQLEAIALTQANLKCYHEARAIFQTASTLVIEGVCKISLLPPNIPGLLFFPFAQNTLVSLPMGLSFILFLFLLSQFHYFHLFRFFFLYFFYYCFVLMLIPFLFLKLSVLP